MNAFFCLSLVIVGMFHLCGYSKVIDITIYTINCLYERMLRVAYKDYKSSSFSEDKSFTVHHRNVQKIAIEMYKVKNELYPKIMQHLFKEVTHSYYLRNSLICGSYKINTACPKIWSNTPDEIRESASSEIFSQTKFRKPNGCSFCICKKCIASVGFCFMNSSWFIAK